MIPLRDDIRSVHRPWVSYAMMALCAGVYGYQIFNAGHSAAATDRFYRTWGMIPVAILNGERLWTLVTSMFLHGGPLHFLGNMLYLWIFGDNVEDVFGHLRYLLLYILSGIAGGLLHVLVAPYSATPTIGASGAISGVMGAYFVLFPRARILTLVPIFFFLRLVLLPAPLLLGFWILFQLLYGCSSSPGTGGVAYFAHIGGFFVGALLGFAARRRQRRPWYEIS